MIRVLITGASGFIGTHCLRRLRTETCEIHAVNRAGQGEGGDRVKWHAADLRDPVQAEALVATIRPTHLLHAAWVATPRVYSSSPENVDWLKASIALAWAFGECGGTRFVGVGSSAEYEPGEGHVLRMKLRSALQRFTVSAKRRVGSAYRQLPNTTNFPPLGVAFS